MDTATAVSNAHKLTEFFDLTDEDFSALPKKVRNQPWSAVLGVPPLEGPKNLLKKLASLRQLFNNKAYAFLDRSGPKWVECLLSGKVLCSLCYKRNSKSGIMMAAQSNVAEHMNGKPHGNELKHYNRSQMRIYEAPGGAVHMAAAVAGKDAKHRHQALVAGSLVAGGRGASGMPYSALPKVFTAGMLAALEGLRGGMPSALTLRDTSLPTAVQLVEQRIAGMLKGVPVYIAFDGGSAYHLAGGHKVICVVAGSMAPDALSVAAEARAAAASGGPAERPPPLGDVLLDVLVINGHETAEVVAKIVEATCVKYNVSKENVYYGVADNATLNKAAVDKLRAMGFTMEYTRCLPHSLALALKAFLDVFDKELALCTNLKAFRGFITAGGGRARKGLALEYGIKMSRIDFVETRWASLLKALLAIINLQTAADLRAARILLQELADEGDADAEAALKEPDTPQLLINAMYHFIEALTEDSLTQRNTAGSGAVDGAEADLPKLRKKLLKFLSSLNVFAGLVMIDIVMGGDKSAGIEKVPTLMSLTQGSAGYAATLKSSVTGVVPDAVTATRALMRRLSDLHYPWADFSWPLVVDVEDPDRDAKLAVIERLQCVEAELRQRLKVQANAVISASRASNEHLYETGEPFAEDAVEKYMERTRLQWDKVVPQALTLLQRACTAVDEAAGTKKLEECVAGLEQSQCFDLNNKPRDFSGKPGLKAYLGCSDMKFTEFSRVEEGWRLHVGGYRPPASPLSPPEVCGALISVFFLQRYPTFNPFFRPVRADLLHVAPAAEGLHHGRARKSGHASAAAPAQRFRL